MPSKGGQASDPSYASILGIPLVKIMPVQPPRKKGSAEPPESDTTQDDEPMRLGGALASVAGDDNVESRIYRAVFESIMSQRLPPGTKLPEAALCELFSTTRSTVRQALLRLAHDHIVQLRPNKGAMVVAPTAEETHHVFEARRGLEDTLVRLAAARATPAEVKLLKEQLAEEVEAMKRFNQPAWARLTSSFHLKVAELARNPILQRYLVEMISRCSLIVALYEQPGNAACEHDEHEGIVKCIAAHDADGAAHVMKEHLLELERNVMVRVQGGDNGLKEMLGL
jgi:DNA-binding GntR family transcriptional regulator